MNMNFNKLNILFKNIFNIYEFFFSDSELEPLFRRAISLRLPKSSNSNTIDRNRLYVSTYHGKSSMSMTWTPDKTIPVCPARHSTSTIDAPAPEYLARNLLQLGCPVVSMPT